MSEITPTLIDWIKRQHMFFVATAPLKPDGHVNLSPKGIEGTFHLVDSNTVWYEDLWGSGNETISHIKENGRITILFLAFKGAPKIVRLYGKATVHEIGTPEYDVLLPAEVRKPGSRAIIMVDVYQVATSCGWSVPWYEYKGQRNTLVQYAAKMEAGDNDDLEGKSDPSMSKFSMKKWWKKENIASLDGLEGLTSALGFSGLFRNSGVPPASAPEISEQPTQVPAIKATSNVDANVAKTVATFLWGFLAAVIALHFVR